MLALDQLQRVVAGFGSPSCIFGSMMAAAFVGLNVSVTLKEPPVLLHGLVSGVGGQRLYLTDVRFLKSGKQLKQYTIHGAEIADIEVLPDPSSAPSIDLQFATADASRAKNERGTPQDISALPIIPFKPTEEDVFQDSQWQTKLPPQTRQQFADPAILSFSRISAGSKSLGTNQNPNLPVLRANFQGHSESGQNDHQPKSDRRADIPATFQSSGSKITTSNAPISDSTPSAAAISASGPDDTEQHAEDLHSAIIFSQTIPSTEESPVSVMPSISAAGSKTSTRRRKRGKAKQTLEPQQADDVDTSPEYIKKGIDSASSGWRQTPILQQQAHTAPSVSSRSVPGTAGVKSALQSAPRSANRSKRPKDLALPTANGWATEDASDVHGMGDFDFEANLSKFDKLAVWDELRNGDTTADEDRLVSLNRVKPPPLPGTFGGKKLHPSENVLERPRMSSHDYDLGDSEDDLDVVQRSTSRRMRRDLSKSSLRQSVSRKDSMNTSTEIPAAALGSQRSITHRSWSQAKHSDSHSNMSPRVQEFASPASSTFSPSAPDTRKKPSLRYAKTDQVCRTMAPDTLDAVENLAHNGFGISEDILAENAGRGIAEMVLLTINPKGQRLGQPSINSSPVVVILVGDHKAGGRALAAARHLLERNIRVVASLTGSVDLENGPLSSQIHRFRGKFLRTWLETSVYLKTLDAPPELIIDALLGLHSSFDDLETEHLNTAMDMVAWANKSKASVLAIDIPSGVDPSSGRVDMREGEPAEVRAKIVVSCGAPCSGLFKALVARQNEDGWRVFIVDIGINPCARPFLRVNTNQKDSRHRGKYIQFGSDWVVGLRFDAGNMT